MQINCISCGHRFDLGKNYDDYEGYVKCSTCAGLLDIVTQDGDVKRVRPGMEMAPQQSTAQLPVPTHAHTPPVAPTMDADAIMQMQRTILELQQSLASTQLRSEPETELSRSE